MWTIETRMGAFPLACLSTLTQGVPPEILPAACILIQPSRAGRVESDAYRSAARRMIAVCRLATCRLATCRLAACRLAACRLAACRLATCCFTAARLRHRQNDVGLYRVAHVQLSRVDLWTNGTQFFSEFVCLQSHWILAGSGDGKTREA